MDLELVFNKFPIITLVSYTVKANGQSKNSGGQSELPIIHFVDQYL